jgi:hypothetical protein
MQDYQQNRKTAGSNAFGQSAFGGTTQPSAAPSLFGQPQPQPAQPQPANPIFGSFGNTAANNANTGTGNAFSGLGQNPAQPTGGFGTFNQTSQQPAASGFGAFGQPQQQPQQQQPPQQPPQQQQGASLFGSTGAFGSQNKPAGGFGKLCVMTCTFNLLVVQGRAALGVPPTLDLPVCLDRPTPPSSQLLPLVCLGRVNQRITLLVGVHSVSKIRIADLFCP